MKHIEKHVLQQKRMYFWSEGRVIKLEKHPNAEPQGARQTLGCFVGTLVEFLTVSKCR